MLNCRVACCWLVASRATHWPLSGWLAELSSVSFLINSMPKCSSACSCQARSYVEARGGSCLLVLRHLNFFETQTNVMRNCKKKKYGRKSRTNLLLLLCAYVPPHVVTCNIFVLYCSWQTQTPLGELTVLPWPPSWLGEGRQNWGRGERKGDGRIGRYQYLFFPTSTSEVT